MDIERRRIVVRGRVQGVWFRASCAREATARGLTGWVRNRQDGSVEAVVEGAPPDVAALVAWCRQGPPGAVVEDVDVTVQPPTGEAAFRILGWDHR